jgi:hypothetical protein
MSPDLYGKAPHCVIEYNFVLFSQCETGGSGSGERLLSFVRSAGKWSSGGCGVAPAPAGRPGFNAGSEACGSGVVKLFPRINNDAQL